MPSRNEQQWSVMLKRLAERDGSIELSRASNKDDSAKITYRSRVFEVMADGCIVVEKPRQAVQEHALRVREHVDLTLMVNSQRMVATSTLLETFTYRVNAALKVTCYRFSPARRPMREQRRSFFRVSVAAMELKPTVLRWEIDEEPFSYKGRLVNLSAGGMGVSVRASRHVLNQIKRTRQLQCTAYPNDVDTIDAPVCVTHIEALGDDGIYIGMKFALEDETQAKAHEQAMQHLCTEIQRMQLRRRRA